MTYEDIACALAAAERDREPIPPLSGLDLDGAYTVQKLNVDRRTAAGAHVTGYKVGLTSRAMQQMLGVDQPDFGHLLDIMRVEDSTDAGRYIAPRAEVEVAFVLAADLRGPGVRADDVLAATAAVRPAIEIIDSRITDWRITLADTVADNASSAGYVLGEPHPPEVDLAALRARTWLNGELAESGAGADVLGHPAEAVAWLANTLGARGVTLRAGQVILPGACARAVAVAKGDRVEADFDVIGRVAVEFT
ncbi:2-keto-4-pentenoate hydratase [Nonomuraea sp. LPB2021202275-12-8]|uniref:2-keto-4-pentenoate hydratase n=1 Tax=Nonomuraea sp. LPB2021202275-12-8 TaxID=3120159 RepID=UPI00300CD052